MRKAGETPSGEKLASKCLTAWKRIRHTSRKSFQSVHDVKRGRPTQKHLQGMRKGKTKQRKNKKASGRQKDTDDDKDIGKK